MERVKVEAFQSICRKILLNGGWRDGFLADRLVIAVEPRKSKAAAQPSALLLIEDGAVQELFIEESICGFPINHFAMIVVGVTQPELDGLKAADRFEPRTDTVHM